MERPQWAAVESMIDELRAGLDEVVSARQRVLAITGTAWSEDRLVKAVVGPRGQLTELVIDPRIYRNPDSTALAASILSTVRAAVEAANAKTREIMESVLPRDTGLDLRGTEADRMLDSHDADLPRLFGEEGGDGHILHGGR